ncbi:MAG: L,D-transpeptidase [Pseudomonadota bacterium]
MVKFPNPEFAVHSIIARLSALLLVSALAACGAPNNAELDGAPAPTRTLPGYEGVQDGEFFIQPVDRLHLVDQNIRTEVAYTAGDAPGSIVVDIFARKLYYILEGNRAVRYGIAVGREGLSFKGMGYIGRKAEWPSWQPTANMIRTRPDLYAQYAGGLPGGLENPLGARALYLYRGGRDTMFRIHGTVDNASVGRATSAGCIRLFNQDAIDLYNRVDSGTKVKVRTLEESLATEGPYMNDAYGRVVPESPEAVARKAADEATIAAKAEQDARLAAVAEEKAAKEAAKAEKKRLSACKRKGIAVEDCPIVELALN